MLTKSELAYEVAEMADISSAEARKAIDAIAEIAQDEIAQGEDFSLPGLVKISYRYTAPRNKGEMYKKGETYVGFGGVEQVAEADSKARAATIKLVATPATQVRAHMPKKSDKKGMSTFLRSKAGKAVVGRKA